MHAVRGLCIALLTASLAIAVHAQEAVLRGVVTVIDGDTIEMHGQSIRLSGIDAPERGRRCGAVNVYQRAALALSEATRGQSVSCTRSGTDAYGRVVATCSAGGTDLNRFMVASGWARDWPRYSNRAYASAEGEARRARRGVWGLDCPADVWSNRDYSELSPAPASSAPAPSPPRTADAAYVTASTLNVRALADANAQRLGQLNYGARVDVIERAGSWARIDFAGGEAWVHGDYLSAAPPPAAAPQRFAASDDDIRRRIIQQSLSRYSGSCPCPYNVDRGGRRCGGRSAYSRPGGASPICYPSDISDAQVRAFRSTQGQ